MKKSRREQIEELQAQVFGKNAPKRDYSTTMESMMQEARLVEANLKNLEIQNNQFDEKLDLQLEQLNKNSQSFQSILEQQAKDIQNMSSIRDDEMKLFSEELEKDFGYKTLDIQEFDSLEETMNQTIVGQAQAVKQSVIAFKRPYVLKDEKCKALNAMLIIGPNGSGKHTIVKEMGKNLNREIISIDLSKYSNSEDEKLFLQDIYSAIYKKNSILLFENPETCHTGFLSMLTSFFKEGSIELKKRYTDNKGQLQETNSSFVTNAIHSIDATDHYLVLISHLKKNKLVDLVGIEFMNSLSDIIETKSIDESIDALIEQSIQKLTDKGQSLFELELDQSIKQYYKKEYSPSLGGHSIDKISDSILLALQQFKLEKGNVDHVRVTYDQSLLIESSDETQDLLSFISKMDSVDIDEIKKELDEIVGLKEVKEYVLSLEDNYKIQKLREQQGLKNASISKHMIFTGNPGTGKTTIARLISKYLRAIGILSGGQLVEVTRADLVGRYVGHTAPLTTQVIQSALGGVLFIDEAYSLYRGKDDSFGLECIDTIVKGIEDHRDNLIVILAGYQKEMNEFLESNSGLKSRFPNIIDFKDYTADELVQISISIAKSKDYFISEECKQPLFEYFDRIQKDNSKMSGNGRMARNKVEEAILKQGSRLLKDSTQNLQELKLCDFQLDESSFVR